MTEQELQDLIGTRYEVEKAASYIKDETFFPYYNVDVQSIPEDIKNCYGVNARLKGTILKDEEMLKAGLSDKKRLGKKSINTSEYFCYKKFTFPCLKDPEISALFTINKQNGDVNVGVIDGTGDFYQYREFLNGSHGQNKIANMVMMQLEFWLAYFAHKGIMTKHTYGTFIC